jgi:hypothetical protein
MEKANELTITEWQPMNERKQWERLQEGHRLRSEGVRPVFGERVDLELRVGSWRQSTRSAGTSIDGFQLMYRRFPTNATQQALSI